MVALAQPYDRPYRIGVTSVRFLRSTEVRKEPRLDAAKIGAVRSGTRSVPLRAQQGDRDCPRWIEIAPRGWACEDMLEPTDQPPSVAQPVALDSVAGDDERSLVPGVYGVVRGTDVQAYSTGDDVSAGNGRVLDGPHSVRAVGTATIDGVRYWRTSQGDLIEASSIVTFSPSKFKGVVVTDPAHMPAWVRGHDKPRDPVPVRDAAGKLTGEKLPARTVVTIAELSADGKLARIDTNADRWLPRRDLRATALTTPPPTSAATEKWFDVDVDEQVLVAYEGDKPVYATMISSGKYQHETPAIIARILAKHETAHMVNPKGNEKYSVADVPWTMYYDGNYALHTSYWHDGFGSVRSHGCINLSPRDARVLYHWSSPDVPPGWTAVYGDADTPGSLVRVHSHRVPDPDVRGYARTLIAAVH